MKTHPIGMPFGQVTRDHLRESLAEFARASSQLHGADQPNERAALLQALVAASALAMRLDAYLKQPEPGPGQSV